MWSEERVRRELEEFLEDAAVWPSYRDFQRHGRRNLRDKVTQFGGARLWARRLGLPYPERKPGYAARWTDGRVREELSEFVRGRVEWPSRLEFEHAGRKRLRDAVGRLGGPERWAPEFGLPLRDLKSGSKLAWTPERIELELRAFLAGRDAWPARREFEQAGRGALLGAIYRFEGGAYWARRVGVSRTTRATSSGPRIWTDQLIAAELEEFCRGRTTWPTEREFVSSGKRNLYSAASRRGGVDRWASALGLARGRRVSGSC